MANKIGNNTQSLTKDNKIKCNVFKLEFLKNSVYIRIEESTLEILAYKATTFLHKYNFMLHGSD